MYHVLIAAFATCVACELFETEKIYATDDYAIAKRRIELARERIAVAEAQVREKGERKSARLEQAQVALVHAEQKMKQMCMATGRTFMIVTFIGATAVRWYYSYAEQKTGLRLPFAAPARWALGTGEDERDLNPTAAYFIVTYLWRVVFGDVLGRKTRQIEAYWSTKDTERYMAAHRQTFNSLTRDSTMAVAPKVKKMR